MQPTHDRSGAPTASARFQEKSLTPESAPSLLTGIRVLDFTRVLSGPFCTALLGDLGAEIIKVEPPQGDDYRAIGPMRNGESALFNVVNRNKRSIVLDLKSPAAREIVHRLVPTVDVVVENFRPGVADKLGIGYEELARIHPKLVYTSISGFGQSGPDARRPAYDIIMQALSGVMESTGFPDSPPTMVGEAMADVVSGLFASWGTLAALIGVRTSGHGTHIDAAMLDATLAFTVTAVARFLFTGRDAARTGNRHPLSAPFGVFQAQDGYFALAVLNNKLFAQLADTIGQPALAADPRFASDELRSNHESVLRERIEHWSAQASVAAVVAQLDAAGIPAAPIQNVRQALTSNYAQQRDLLHPVDHPRVPDLKLPHQPLQFSGWTLPETRRAPDLGGDRDALLHSLLGLTGKKITELAAAGAFGTPQPSQPSKEPQ